MKSENYSKITHKEAHSMTDVMTGLREE